MPETISNPAPSSARRHPKGDKRQRTRAKLLDAAAIVIREKGYEGTTLADVAERAGMTRGAIYGNFRNRDELFLAVVAQRWEPIVPRIRLGDSFRKQMRALADAVIAAFPQRRKSAVGAASFQAYALRHEDMRQRLVAANAEIYRSMAAGVAQMNHAHELPMPPEQLVRVLHFMTEGYLMLRFLTPELIGDDAIIAAFDVIGRSAPPS
jgi:AcrR family transcriptional regulator